MMIEDAMGISSNYLDVDQDFDHVQRKGYFLVCLYSNVAEKAP